MGILEDKRRARWFYRFLSPLYDRINPFIWNESMRDESIGLLDIDSTDRVLDVGCGTGFATVGLVEHADDVYGLDQSRAQLSRARPKLAGEPVQFMLGDAERLPFPDDSFDIVWSSGSIEYWPEPVKTLADMRRVCRPGGEVLVVGPNTPDSWVLGRLAKAIMLFYDEAEADALFEAAGFEDVEHHLMGPSYRPEIAITTHAIVPDYS